MYAEKIETNAAALGTLAGQIPESAWGVVRLVQSNLFTQARSVRALEERLLVPDDEEDPAVICPDGTDKMVDQKGLFPGEAVPFSVCVSEDCPFRQGCWGRVE